MTKPTGNVVTLGYASMDHFIQTRTFPTTGSKVPFSKYTVMGGGQAATGAVALARWGLSTRYVGRVGDDITGDQSIRWLADEGVISDSALKTAGKTTQTAYIIVPADTGERTVLWQRQPGLNLCASDLRPEWFQDASVLFIDGHELEAAEVAARWVRSNGGVVVLDAEHIGSSRRNLLELTHFAVGSEDFGHREFGTVSAAETISVLRSYGIPFAGVTLGPKGCLVDWGEGLRAFRSIDVEAVDTTGAGDVFHAAIAYGAYMKMSPVEIVSFATVCAGLSCRKLGGRSGIPSLEEAFDRLAWEESLEISCA